MLRALLWSLIHRSAWAQPGIVVMGTKCEGAALASVSTVDVCSTRTCVGAQTGKGDVLASFASAAVRSVTVLAATTGEGAVLSSFRLAGLGSVTVLEGTRGEDV
jgi:hypothetical protein